MSDLLRKDLGFQDGDAVYEALIDAINGLDDQEAMKRMAKLILLLANQIGDEDILKEAIRVASDET